MHMEWLVFQRGTNIFLGLRRNSVIGQRFQLASDASTAPSLPFAGCTGHPYPASPTVEAADELGTADNGSPARRTAQI